MYKREQEIVFDELSDLWIGEGQLGLEATSSVGLEVTFEVDGPATVSGDLIDLTGIGEVTVTATQTGNDYYNAAPEVAHTFEVYKREQEIVFDELTDLWIGEGQLVLTARSNAGLDVTYAVSGPGTLSGSAIEFTGTGIVTVTASQSGDNYYYAAPEVTHSFEVYKGDQEITFGELADVWAGEEELMLTANSNAGLEVSYEISGPGALNGNIIEFTGTGIITVTASQSGSNYYHAAAEVTRTFEVYKRSQNISFEAIEDQSIEASIALEATSDAGLDIEYTLIGPATLRGNILEFTGIGIVEVTAKQEGNDFYMAATSVTQSFEVFRVLGLEDSFTVEIYPNPVVDKLKINSDKPVEVSVYDIHGRLMIEGSNRVDIDFSGIDPGRYIVKVSQGTTSVIKHVLKF